MDREDDEELERRNNEMDREGEGRVMEREIRAGWAVVGGSWRGWAAGWVRRQGMGWMRSRM